MKRLLRTRKLFGFLRAHRDELFDDAFQGELAAMNRDSGAGKDPSRRRCWAGRRSSRPTMACQMQAVEMTVVDLR